MIMLTSVQHTEETGFFRHNYPEFFGLFLFYLFIYLFIYVFANYIYLLIGIIHSI